MKLSMSDGVKARFMTKAKKYRTLKKQRGMTLLEIIIVLGIIGTIAAGVVILAQRAFDTKAISDLATNVNTVRVAIKDAYGPSGVYPTEDAVKTKELTATTILTDAATPIGRLVSLGKISPTEARNGISSNYIDIGPGIIGTNKKAGYFVLLNGLSGKQCRALTVQLGNQWDYVEVRNTGFATDSDTAVGELNLVAAPTFGTLADGIRTAPADATAGGQGILRSLDATNGNGIITPDTVASLCAETAINGLILGSR